MRFLWKLIPHRLFRHAANREVEDSSRYRCVEILPEAGACAAVVALGARKFLPHEIPRLPLADCDRTECRCRYELLVDRRSYGRSEARTGSLPGEAVPGRPTLQVESRPPSGRTGN